MNIVSMSVSENEVALSVTLGGKNFVTKYTRLEPGVWKGGGEYNIQRLMAEYMDADVDDPECEEFADVVTDLPVEIGREIARFLRRMRDARLCR